MEPIVQLQVCTKFIVEFPGTGHKYEYVIDGCGFNYRELEGFALMFSNIEKSLNGQPNDRDWLTLLKEKERWYDMNFDGG